MKNKNISSTPGQSNCLLRFAYFVILICKINLKYNLHKNKHRSQQADLKKNITTILYLTPKMMHLQQDRTTFLGKQNFMHTKFTQPHSLSAWIFICMHFGREAECVNLTCACEQCDSRVYIFLLHVPRHQPISISYGYFFTAKGAYWQKHKNIFFPGKRKRKHTPQIPNNKIHRVCLGVS